MLGIRFLSLYGDESGRGPNLKLKLCAIITHINTKFGCPSSHSL